MKIISIISVSLLMVFAASCKSSKPANQAPKKVSTAPIVVLDAVQNQEGDQVTLTLKEQKEYDPNLLEITASFYRESNGGFSLIDDRPSSKWITKEMGRMNAGNPQLIFSDLKEVARMSVVLTYDSVEIESKTFDFGK